LSHSTFKDVAWPRPGGEGEAEKKMEACISVSRQTDVAKYSNSGMALYPRRLESSSALLGELELWRKIRFFKEVSFEVLSAV
jgi:hypothetical protein